MLEVIASLADIHLCRDVTPRLLEAVSFKLELYRERNKDPFGCTIRVGVNES